MPRTIWKSGYKNRQHQRVLLSNDWFSFTPWTNEGKPLRYFAKETFFSESKESSLDIMYLGPFAFIRAKLL